MRVVEVIGVWLLLRSGAAENIACTTGADCLAADGIRRYCLAAASICVDTPAGSLAIQDGTGMSACPAGTFNANLNGADCAQCAAGTFATDPASTHCTSVAIGYQSAPDFTARVACDAGYFQPTEGNPAGCQPCAAGKYISNAAAANCIPVPIGYMPNVNKSDKVACAPGTFQPTLGGTAGCQQCPVGTYAPNTASEKCICTPTGHMPSVDHTERLPCWPGTYANETCTALCKTCEPGRFSNASGSPDCLCAPKGYTPNVNRTNRLPCTPGTYQDEDCAPNAGGCKACPAGKYTFYAGAHGCNCASMGKRGCDNATCDEPCGKGKYSDERCSAQCDLCPLGRKGDAMITSNCSQCAVGYHASILGMTACEACGLGVYGNDLGMSECKSCSFFSYTPNDGPNKECLSCIKGFSSVLSNGLFPGQCPIFFAAPLLLLFFPMATFL